MTPSSQYHPKIHLIQFFQFCFTIASSRVCFNRPVTFVHLLSARLRLGLLATSIAHITSDVPTMLSLFMFPAPYPASNSCEKSKCAYSHTPLPPPSFLPSSLRLGSQPTAGGAAVCSIPLKGTFVFARPTQRRCPHPHHPTRPREVRKSFPEL